jgi:hypothetical protein
VSLQVTKRAVVAEHVEAVARALERAAGLVSAVVALADIGRQQRAAFIGSEPAHPLEQLRLRER